MKKRLLLAERQLAEEAKKRAKLERERETWMETEVELRANVLRLTDMGLAQLGMFTLRKVGEEGR